MLTDKLISQTALHDKSGLKKARNTKCDILQQCHVSIHLNQTHPAVQALTELGGNEQPQQLLSWYIIK